MDSFTSLKKEADELMKIKGNVRGAILYSHFQYIKLKKKEEGVKAVEKKLAELNYPLKFNEIKILDWYPEGLSHLILLVSKEIFNWNDSEIFEMGRTAPQYSLVVKVLMKYFLSIEEVFRQAPRSWKKHVDKGELETYEFNGKKQYVILRLKDYKFHPIGCIYKKGYFTRLAEYILPNKKIIVKETKCVHKGDSFCEFLVKWK